MKRLALARVNDAVRILGIPALTCGVRFEVEAGHGTASWRPSPGGGLPLITVDQQLALTLSDEALEALLVHEIMHHQGVNTNLLRPGGKNPLLLNLALDIYLERLLSFRCVHLARSFRELNDVVLADANISRRTPLAQSLIMLVHSQPDFLKMPRGFKTRHNQIWRGRIRLTPADIYELLASARGAERLSVEDFPVALRARLRLHQEQIEQLGRTELEGDFSNTTSQSELPSDSGAEAGSRPSEEAARGEEADQKRSKRDWPTDTAGRIRSADDLRFTVTLNQVVADFEARRKRRIGSDAGPVPAARRGEANRTPGESSGAPGNARFNPALALHTLQDGTGVPQIVSSPFLVNPTAGAIAKYLGPTHELYYDNIEVRSPRLSCVYVDVSGSMHVHMDKIVAFARALKRRRPANVFAFATVVKPTRLDDLAQGKFTCGGGTEINAVLRHVLARRLSQFFIVTDNGSHVDQSLLRRVQQRGIESLALVFDCCPPIPWSRTYHHQSCSSNSRSLFSKTADSPFGREFFKRGTAWRETIAGNAPGR